MGYTIGIPIFSAFFWFVSTVSAVSGEFYGFPVILGPHIRRNLRMSEPQGTQTSRGIPLLGT